MSKKKRKPRFQVAKFNTERERVENGIAASHEQPTTPASKAVVKSVTEHATVDRQRMGLPYVADSLPVDIARSIVQAADNLKADPDKIPPIPDDEVSRLIKENPEVALEGLTRLGRVLPMPHSTPDHPVHNGLDLKAKVVADMRAGRIDSVVESTSKAKLGRSFIGTTAEHAKDAFLVDVQAVYDRWMAQDQGHDLYNLVLAPPWFNAMLTYNNDAGNVWLLHMIGSDIKADDWANARGDSFDNLLEEIQWQPQPPAHHTIEWDRVRWVYSVQIYCGGMGQHGFNGVTLTEPAPVPTIGPLMVWRIAVYDDGEPADVHWSHIVQQIPMHKFNNALGTFCETINMVNCTNVHVAYPDRPMQRAQRRRLDRLGVRFSEIHVKPASKSYKGKGQALADMDTALHGVRGHYATYGKDGRGLLFGKYSGRFWIPPHVRGSRDNGEVIQSYVTET